MARVGVPVGFGRPAAMVSAFYGASTAIRDGREALPVAGRALLEAQRAERVKTTDCFNFLYSSNTGVKAPFALR